MEFLTFKIKHKKQLLVISLIFLLILWGFSILFIVQRNLNKRDIFLQSEIYSFSSKISSILGSYEYFGDYIINEKNDDLLKIVDKASSSNSNERKKLSKEFLESYKENFTTLNELGFSQFSIYFSNGENFISTSQNSNYQKIPRLPNVEKKFLKDFGVESFYGGYKYVSFLIYKGKFIGTMEALIPLSSVLHIFTRFYPTIDLSYILDKKYNDDQLETLINPKELNGKRYILDYRFLTVTKNNQILYSGLQTNFFENIEKDFLKNKKNKKNFGLINKFNDKNYVVLFFPVNGSKDDNMGYLTVTYENNQYDTLMNNLSTEIIFINIIIIFLLFAVHLVIKDINKFKILSTTDYLTGLYNRSKFIESANYELLRAQRHNHEFSVLLIDLDHFKLINDNYGHNVGDDILKSASFFIKNEIRKTDLLARWGGEEFICLLPDTNLSQALVVAEKIRRKIEQTHFKNKIELTLSIGAAQRASGDNNVEAINNKADKALYIAKGSGRNKVVPYL